MKTKFFLNFFLILCFFAKAALAAEAMKHGADHSQIFHSFVVEGDVGKASDGKVRAFDFKGWVGGDVDRLWLEGEQKTFGKYDKKSEIKALYGRNISQFWDAQIGVRQDLIANFSSHKPTYLTLGLEGLTPYMLETNLQIFLSDQGNYTKSHL